MIDPNQAVINWLLENASITDLVGQNVVAPLLPKGFSAMEGNKCIVVRTRGGNTHPEIPEMIRPSMEVECWAYDPDVAKQIYAAVHDIMCDATEVDLGGAGVVVTSQEEVFGQDIWDPETQWPYVFSVYRIQFRNPNP